QHDLREVLGGRNVDVAFIDGMHLFEYVLRDFRNIEPYCGRDSVVLIHDSFPLIADAASRQRASDAWTGDTWKIVPCLRALRPDLDIVTIAVRPSGLTLISTLDPMNRTLTDRYDEALERFGNLSFTTIDGRQDEALNVVANDWDAVRAHLP